MLLIPSTWQTVVNAATVLGIFVLSLCVLQLVVYRALAGPQKSLKVLEFFSGFSRPGKSLKTDVVLENS